MLKNKVLMLAQVNIGIDKVKTLKLSQNSAGILLNIVALFGRKGHSLKYECFS